MFLSKKNAIYFNKPKTNEGSKPKRILAGNLSTNQVGMMKNNKKMTT